MTIVPSSSSPGSFVPQHSGSHLRRCPWRAARRAPQAAALPRSRTSTSSCAPAAHQCAMLLLRSSRRAGGCLPATQTRARRWPPRAQTSRRRPRSSRRAWTSLAPVTASPQSEPAPHRWPWRLRLRWEGDDDGGRQVLGPHFCCRLRCITEQRGGQEGREQGDAPTGNEADLGG
jgi:hypothetical protein